MIWMRYRMVDGRPVPVLSPVVYASTGTITKDGVMFFKPNGEVVDFVPLEKICEFVEDQVKYTLKLTPEEYTDKDGKLHQYNTREWILSIPIRDRVGKIIG